MTKIGLAVFLLIIVSGCRVEGDVSEDLLHSSAPVSYTLDLMGEGYGLQEPFSMMTVTEKRKESDRLGLAGLLIVHTHAGGDRSSYTAFDLACPSEWPSVVPVKIKEEGSMEVVCPKCGTVYDLSLGVGVPKSGKSRYPLWQYRTLFRDTFLEIINSNIGY